MSEDRVQAQIDHDRRMREASAARRAAEAERVAAEQAAES